MLQLFTIIALRKKIVQVFCCKLVSSFKVFNWLPFLVLHTWLHVAVIWNGSCCTSCKDWELPASLPVQTCELLKEYFLLSVALVWLYSLDSLFSIWFLCCLYLAKVWIIWIPKRSVLQSLFQVIRVKISCRNMQWTVDGFRFNFVFFI